MIKHDLLAILTGFFHFKICSKAILESLRKRAHIMTDGFNSCRNVVCNFTEGMIRVTFSLNFVCTHSEIV
jgi:hypothetical protein